jgi:non-ribosomal peptide synthetase component F
VSSSDGLVAPSFRLLGFAPARSLPLTAAGWPALETELARPSTAMVTGNDGWALSVAALRLLEGGWRIVMPPSLTTRGQLPGAPCALRIDCQADAPRIRRFPGGGRAATGGWALAMGTSGTTAAPRLFGFTRAQLRLVTSWYRRVYGVTDRSLFVTALPLAHNLAFVAGLCTAAAVGAAFAPLTDPCRLLELVEARAAAHDRVVILANPVVLERMLRRPKAQRGNVLIDSGGAPLSRTAIAAIRTNVCDIREGYGTTETLSLTHFDRGDDPAAIGTVGRPLDRVRCRVSAPHPALEVTTPLLGVPLSGELRAGSPPTWVRTGDLGELTPEGNLRLLGREQDERIAGLWPRDVLDEIGPVLGYRTALVTHCGGTIRVVTGQTLTPPEEDALRSRLADRCGGPRAPAVEVMCAGDATLYSAKLPRPPASAVS